MTFIFLFLFFLLLFQSADVMFTKKYIRALNKEEFPCKNYFEDQFDNFNFTKCCKAKLWDEIYPRINCTIATMDGITQNETYIYNNNYIESNEVTSTNVEFNTNIINNNINVLLEDCKNALDGKAVLFEFTQMLESLQLNPELFGCPVPCRRVAYDFDVNYYFDKTQGGKFIFIKYHIMNITEKK